MVAAEVRRRILARKYFRLVTSSATPLASIIELTLRRSDLRIHGGDTRRDSKRGYCVQVAGSVNGN